MSTEINVTKYEPSLEIEGDERMQEDSSLTAQISQINEPTTVNSNSEETPNQFEPKREEELNSVFFAQHFNLPQSSRNNETATIIRSGLKLRVVISEAEQSAVANYISRNFKCRNGHIYSLA